MNRILKRILISIIALAGALFLAFKLSPYPATWIIRYAFNKEAIRVNDELEQLVPKNIESISNVHYDENDKDAFLDVYFHRDSVKSKPLPILVWTHGGGLISGDKSQISNYCKILASKGFVVVAIDYTIAPEGKYPKPLQQLNKALAFLSSNADKFHADNTFFILAGDSAGSMISATTANIITSPTYAEITKVQPGLKPDQLRGLLLFCGIYEIDNLKTEGAFGTFLKTVTWAYFDNKDISNDDYAKSASVTHFLTSSFPPAFISAGNNDPLLPQSQLMAKKLAENNIPIDTLFFPENHQPALGHEYQFKLNDAGNLALERSLKFIKSIGE